MTLHIVVNVSWRKYASWEGGGGGANEGFIFIMMTTLLKWIICILFENKGIFSFQGMRIGMHEKGYW